MKHVHKVLAGLALAVAIVFAIASSITTHPEVAPPPTLDNPGPLGGVLEKHNEVGQKVAAVETPWLTLGPDRSAKLAAMHTEMGRIVTELDAVYTKYTANPGRYGDPTEVVNAWFKDLEVLDATIAHGIESSILDADTIATATWLLILSLLAGAVALWLGRMRTGGGAVLTAGILPVLVMAAGADVASATLTVCAPFVLFGIALLVAGFVMARRSAGTADTATSPSRPTSSSMELAVVTER